MIPLEQFTQGTHWCWYCRSLRRKGEPCSMCGWVPPQPPPRSGPLTYGEASRVASLADSFARLDTLIGLQFRVDRASWLKLLGEFWEVCDTVGPHLRRLRPLLPEIGPVAEMMDTKELAAWHALPDVVTIYRGARRHQLGASWSLDRAVAERFPNLMRYKFGGDAVLVTAEVRKRDVLAIKLGREESEAIVLRGRRILSREPIADVDLTGRELEPRSGGASFI